MNPQAAHAKLLRRLVATIMHPMVFAEWAGSMSRLIPRDLLSPQAEAEERTHLSLGGQAYQAFHEVLWSLQGDLRFEHLTKEQLETALWHLACEVQLHPERFREPHQQRERIDSLLGRRLAAVRDIEVLIPIKGIDIDNHVVQIWDGLLIRASSSILDTCRHPHLHQWLANDFLGRTVLVVPERGASLDRAARRGRSRAELLLRVLRSYLSTGWRSVHPGLLGFELSEACFARFVDEHGRGHIARSYERGSIGLQWHPELEGVTETIASHRLVLDLLPARFRRAVELSLHWIGLATVQADHDMKAVMLCTALEALLCTAGDQRKGETIARRLAILYLQAGEGMPHPSRVLIGYEGRGNVVHGSRLGVLGDEDCRLLLTASNEAVGMIVERARSRPGLSKPKLLGELDRPDDLTKLVTWLEERNTDEWSRRLAMHVREVLRRAPEALRSGAGPNHQGA